MRRNFSLILLLSLTVTACAGIKTRKQLGIEGVKVERNNATTSTVVESTPQAEVVRTEVVVKEVAVNPAEKEVAPTAVRTTLDPVSQKVEMASELRRLSGELQDIKDAKALEDRANQEWRLTQEAKFAALSSKLKIYEQSISVLEEEIVHLKALKAKKPKKTKGIFERAEEHMKNKNWKKAILEFENYRKKYPRGRRVSMATYYIGVSFQELSLKEEAKAFFQETVDKYPKTTAFNKAKYRLKQLK